MKKVLGLDLGVASIGWALVNEADKEGERSSIQKVGVRVVPLNQDEEGDFLKGKGITTNATRTEKRGMRRNVQRYKLRRENLKSVLLEAGLIASDSKLNEDGKDTTFETYRLRSKAVSEPISLEELARVLFMLNGKRGYKSNRKMNDSGEGGEVDDIQTAKILSGRGITPGEYALELLDKGEKKLPAFYRSDLESEFSRVWSKQQEYYPEQLSDELFEKLRGKNSKATFAIMQEVLHLEGLPRASKKAADIIRETYQWRVSALNQQMRLEELSVVLSEINRQIASASSYLGKISDRSKVLAMNDVTVGQYLYSQLQLNPHASLKNQVFYRQDYIDEFNKIWDTQSKFHSELTPELKKRIGEETIFYQRPLRSQKGLVSLCEFEHREIVIGDTKKTIGLRACPKSSPLFQEFKVRQCLNNLIISEKGFAPAAKSVFGEMDTVPEFPRALTPEEREMLYAELLFKSKMKDGDVLKLLFGSKKASLYRLNYKEIEGNCTMSELFSAYDKILKVNGRHIGENLTASRKISEYEESFSSLDVDTGILHFDSSLDGQSLERQPLYGLWHLLYSYEGDNSKSGNEALIAKLCGGFGFDKDSASHLCRVHFKDDYANLSAKAIRRIMPFLKDGEKYSDACEKAGYRHSARSLTSTELDAKVLVDHLDHLPKNSLRNPVVEKILNQMVNLVNAVVEQYGKPDEIRIEMARELKKSAEERKEVAFSMANQTKENDRIKTLLESEFGMQNVSRNAILRYRLYEELEKNGYKTLYSNTYISHEELFGNNFDIEHIIPQAVRFDDSFANKTLELGSVNRDKGKLTAYDYMKGLGEDKLSEYENCVRDLAEKGVISRTKAKNLLTPGEGVPEGFLERDLRDSQYIAKKAREILESMVRVVTPTIGSVTDRLRKDWGLEDVMKELNLDKYDKCGLTYYSYNGEHRIRKIKDWTKRNDNRHHAMDAITVAFTKPSYIQYLNNLNARRDKMPFVPEDAKLADVRLADLPLKDRARVVSYIENKELHRDDNGHLIFNAPIPRDEFRTEAKRHLNETLISIKAKNKVVTENYNIYKSGGERLKKKQFTPRGALHNETIYGKINQYALKEESVGSRFNAEKIASVASKAYREALLARLNQYGGDPKKAFTGKNSLANNPLWLDAEHSVRVPERVNVLVIESWYTKRVAVSEALVKDGKISEDILDERVRRVLSERLERSLESCGGDVKAASRQAFSNLEKNPIWLDKERGIAVKRVTVKASNGNANLIPIRDKKDKDGRCMLDADGNRVPTDYVAPCNNHHIAIYRDENGNLQEHVVSFIEAVSRVNDGYPPVDRDYKKSEGWEFIFSMKKNEFFVFPNETTGFDPQEVDLADPANYAEISPNLFRVQVIASKFYVFRHHLETTVDENKALRDVTWKRIASPNGLKGIVKVRLNHLGQIVHIGE